MRSPNQAVHSAHDKLAPYDAARRGPKPGRVTFAGRSTRSSTIFFVRRLTRPPRSLQGESSARPIVRFADADRDAARMTDRVRENCAFADDELVLVRRVYVVPARGTTRITHVVPEPELWCVSCVSQYPCELADGERGRVTG